MMTYAIVFSSKTGNTRLLAETIRALLPEGETVTPLEGQSFGWFDLAGEMPPELLSPDRPVWEFLAGTR